MAGFNVIAMAADDECSKRLTADVSVSFIPLPMKSDSTRIREDISLFFRYLNIYRHKRPVVTLHINNKPNIYGSIAASLLGIPTISNITGLGVVAEKKGIMKAIVYGLYRLAFRSSRAFVFFQNKDDQDFFLHHHLVTESKTRVIPGSGVDTEKFSTKHEQNKKQLLNTTVFLYNGRLVISKGIELFIEAARVIKRNYPQTSFHIIGEHDPDNRVFINKEILDKAERDGIIKYHGLIDDVRSTIAASDCVVLPSFYREGVPRALLEAASMGKPLIAANSPGTREPVDNGINGYLVIPESLESLVDAMSRFMEQSLEQRTKMGSASRMIAKERFSDTIVLNAYLEEIQRIAREGHSYAH